MTFLLYLTGLLFIGAIAALVTSPLLRANSEQKLVAEIDDPLERWEKQKTDAYAAIKEAEFDRQMGKLTDEDYQVLRNKYEARALEALAQLDRLAQPRQKREGSGTAAVSNEA
jgi:hypothetical protein